MPAVTGSGAGGWRGLRMHAVLLVVVLVGLWPLMTEGGVFHADEGAVLAQEQLLADTGHWSASNPQPELDPRMEALPLELSTRWTDGQWSPYTKHPVYVVTTRLASAVAGSAGPVLISVLGTAAAAVMAAVLANRVSPGTGPVALWATGVASPLFFDAYVVQAHALGAALVAAAALAASMYLDPGRWRWGWLLLSALMVACAVLVRTEALFIGAALGAGLVVAARQPLRGLLTGAVLVVIAAGIWYAEPRLVRGLFGEQLPSIRSGRAEIEPASGQIRALRETWIGSAYGTGFVSLGVLGLVAATTAAVATRLRSDRVVQAASVVAVVAFAIRASDGGLVPGLLVSCPLLVGIVALTGDALRAPTARMLLVGWAVFSVAVIATQYDNGGGANWGGRFFAIGIPMAIPVAVAGWRTGLHRLHERTRTIAMVSGAAVAFMLGTLAMSSMRGERDTVENVVASMLAARERASDPPAPVLASTGILTRFAWEHSRDGVWMTVRPSDLLRFGSEIAAESDEFVLVSLEPELDLRLLSDVAVPRQAFGPFVVLLRAVRT